MTTRLIDQWIAEKLGWADVGLEPCVWRWHPDYMQAVLVGTKDGERQPIPDYGEDFNATLPEIVRLTGAKGFRVFTDPDYGLGVEVWDARILPDTPTHLHATTPAECLFEALCWLLMFDTNDTKDKDGNWIEVQG